MGKYALGKIGPQIRKELKAHLRMMWGKQGYFWLCLFIISFLVIINPPDHPAIEDKVL